MSFTLRSLLGSDALMFCLPMQASQAACRSKESRSINVKGVLHSIQTALPLLGQHSSIIVNTSINNQIGQAGASVYGASKAAAPLHGQNPGR